MRIRRMGVQLLLHGEYLLCVGECQTVDEERATSFGYGTCQIALGETRLHTVNDGVPSIIWILGGRLWKIIKICWINVSALIRCLISIRGMFYQVLFEFDGGCFQISTLSFRSCDAFGDLLDRSAQLVLHRVLYGKNFQYFCILFIIMVVEFLYFAQSLQIGGSDYMVKYFLYLSIEGAMCQCLCCDCWWHNCCGVACAGYHGAYLACSYWLCKPDGLATNDPECCHWCACDGWGYNCFCLGNICCAPASVRQWSQDVSAGRIGGRAPLANQNYTS